jgi:inhibitor of nuclear factor kappa-B kinase subunit alpha
MARLTLAQRIFIVKIFYDTKSATDVQRKFKYSFNGNTVSRLNIYKTIRKFEETGSVKDAQKSGRPKTSRSDENVSTLQELMQDSPENSIRRTSSETGISKSSVHNIIRKDLELYPYKIQIMQSLNITDQVERLSFCNWASDVIDTYADAFNDVWFSDESHFLLSGHVCKQNMRFWANEQRHQIAEMPLHSDKVTVWCAMSSRGIIGPYVFSDTVNSDRYISLLNNKFLPELRKRSTDINSEWFMQDGATPHTANKVLDMLHDTFDERVISRRYPEVKQCGVTWPAHSPDLNPCDFFLWGYLKSVVYKPRPTDTAMLLKQIRREVKKISVDTCARVIENFKQRVREGKRQKGRHLENVMNY